MILLGVLVAFATTAAICFLVWALVSYMPCTYCQLDNLSYWSEQNTEVRDYLKTVKGNFRHYHWNKASCIYNKELTDRRERMLQEKLNQKD